jgi:putative ABC transport system ATP-binding protein
MGIKMEEILKVENVEYTYQSQGGPVKAVKHASASFIKGKVYAITGSSGSGKSTLLSLLAGLDLPQKGSIIFKGRKLKDIDRNIYRSNDIGIVFQAFNLIPHYTALENVKLSLEISRLYSGNQNQTARELLLKVGIDETKANRKVLKLSGGEQQRVAIARALAIDPELILADEPTGNLDSENGKAIMRQFLAIAHEEERCIVIVTHSNSLAKQADEVWGMKDGVLLPIRIAEEA